MLNNSEISLLVRSLIKIGAKSTMKRKNKISILDFYPEDFC